MVKLVNGIINYIMFSFTDSLEIVQTVVLNLYGKREREGLAFPCCHFPRYSATVSRRICENIETSPTC